MVIVEIRCYYGHQSLQIPLVTLFYYWRLVSVVMERGAGAFSHVLINTQLAWILGVWPPLGEELPQPPIPLLWLQ